MSERPGRAQDRADPGSPSGTGRRGAQGHLEDAHLWVEGAEEWALTPAVTGPGVRGNAVGVGWGLRIQRSSSGRGLRNQPEAVAAES